MLIRAEAAVDQEAIFQVHHLAFGRPDEAELVEALRAGGHVLISLVAEVKRQVVGHVLFSRLPILTADGPVAAVALAPLAVRPEQERQGIGSQLIREGLPALANQGERIVVVLGHPEFYQRFGFSAKLAEPLQSPFSGPAWLALELTPGALAGTVGLVRYPPPFGLD